MYFFKTVLSLFDEEKETIFLIPDTDGLEKDELPFFSETELTAHPKFTEFVKRTKTAIVDVEFELYETKNAAVGEISAEAFEQMSEQNQLELLDSNNFCIQTRKIKRRKNKKSKLLFPLIGIGAAALVLIASVTLKKTPPKADTESGILSEVKSGISSDVSDNESDVSDNVSENSLLESGLESLTESTVSDVVSSISDSLDASEQSEVSSDKSESSTESTQDEDISDHSEIMESDDGESFDFPPPEDIQHM